MLHIGLPITSIILMTSHQFSIKNEIEFSKLTRQILITQATQILINV